MACCDVPFVVLPGHSRGGDQGLAPDLSVALPFLGSMQELGTVSGLFQHKKPYSNKLLMYVMFAPSVM